MVEARNAPGTSPALFRAASEEASACAAYKSQIDFVPFAFGTPFSSRLAPVPGEDCGHRGEGEASTHN